MNIVNINSLVLCTGLSKGVLKILAGNLSCCLTPIGLDQFVVNEIVHFLFVVVVRNRLQVSPANLDKHNDCSAWNDNAATFWTTQYKPLGLAYKYTKCVICKYQCIMHAIRFCNIHV